MAIQFEKIIKNVIDDLRKATEANDPEAIFKADKKTARILEHKDLNRSEHEKYLLELQRAHSDALDLMRKNSDILQSRLSAMKHNPEGIRSYYEADREA